METFVPADVALLEPPLDPPQAAPATMAAAKAAETRARLKEDRCSTMIRA
jgi:hypothetical protein